MHASSPWSASCQQLECGGMVRRSAQFIFRHCPPQLPSCRKTLISHSTRCMQRVGASGIGSAVASFYGGALQIFRGMLAMEAALIPARLNAGGTVVLTHWIHL